MGLWWEKRIPKNTLNKQLNSAALVWALCVGLFEPTPPFTAVILAGASRAPETRAHVLRDVRGREPGLPARQDGGQAGVRGAGRAVDGELGTAAVEPQNDQTCS